MDPASTTGEIHVAVHGFTEVVVNIYQVTLADYSSNVFDFYYTLANNIPNSATKGGKLVSTQVRFFCSLRFCSFFFVPFSDPCSI
jgi:hypothetical protein